MLEETREKYSQYRNIRVTMSLICLFLVSMVMSCQELRYIAFGKTVDATLELTNPEKDLQRGVERQKLVATYSFMDNDTFRRERQDIPTNWRGAGAKTVKVQYIPGRPEMSRIAGTSNKLWPIIFIGSVVVMGVWAFMVARQT